MLISRHDNFGETVCMSEVATQTRTPAVATALVERVAAPVIRGSWAALLTTGLVVGQALNGRSTAVAVVGNGLFWILWGLGLIAVLVWHPVGLVGLRCLSPVAFVAALWASRQSGVSSWLGLLGVVCATAALVATQWSETGHLCVNGPAYPNERRFLLRPTAALLLGPIPLSGALIGVGVLAGPLLLAAKQWIAGAVALGVGAPLIRILGKALLAQVRRFVVFVPAGFVVHDEFVLRDPVLFLRRFVDVIHAATTDSDSLDLMNNAGGLAIEVLLTEKVEIVKIVSRKQSETGSTARFLFVPTLPGRLLAEARTRRMTK
jgi:hypothetical protein